MNTDKIDKLCDNVFPLIKALPDYFYNSDKSEYIEENCQKLMYIFKDLLVSFSTRSNVYMSFKVNSEIAKALRLPYEEIDEITFY